MSYRPHPTRKGAWQIRIYVGGKEKEKVFPFIGTEAECIIEHDRYDSIYKKRRFTRFPTIRETLPDYLVYYGTIASERIVTEVTSLFTRELLPYFGNYQSEYLDPMMFIRYTDKRLKDGVSHRTIEKELGYFGAMLRWMKKFGKADCVPEITKPPKAKCTPKKIQQPLTLDELNKLLDSVPEDKKVILLLMSDAGLRCEEALHLKVADVDLTGERITIRGKGEKVIVYPILTKRLYEALRSSDGNLYVSANPKTGEAYGSIKTLLRLASKRAGISKHVTHHTLRHTFSTLLMECDTSTEGRKILMRHSSLQSTEHYTHTSPTYMKRQAQSYSDLINGVTE